MAIVRSNRKTAQDLEKELQLSSALVSMSTNKLLNKGLIKRAKEAGSQLGRPRYVYYIPDPSEFKAKMIKEIEDCMNSIRHLISTQL